MTHKTCVYELENFSYSNASWEFLELRKTYKKTGWYRKKCEAVHGPILAYLSRQS